MRYHVGAKQAAARVLSIAVIVSIVLTGLVAINTKSSSAVGALCADGATLLVNGSASPNAVFTTNQPIQLKLNSTNPDAGQITKVLFYMNDSTPLGKGVRDGTYSWFMYWAPGLANVSSGQTVQITAKVFYNDTASGNEIYCSTINPISTQLYSPTISSLNMTVNPTQWSGPMGTPVGITTETIVSDSGFNPAQFAIYTWSSTIGHLTPDNENAQLGSGFTIGTGIVKVKVQYSGAAKDVVIPIEVKGPNAPLPPPSTETTTQTSPTNKTTTTNTNNPDSTTNVIEPTVTVQNPTAQDCVASAIGLERFTAINNGTVRPTQEEIEKYKICFATSNYIVPSNFAPVAPAGIKKLPIFKTVQVTKIENEKRVTENVEKNVLRFGGKAEPNSIVFLYVFSDPLVLTTTTDGDGNWEYILEDPIEPGNHEVYSVVNRGNGVYERSEVLSFSLSETAEAATINPNGLTLKLANATPTESQRSLSLYIFGSISVLALAIAGFILTLVKRNRVSTGQNTFSAFPAEQPISIAANQPEDVVNSYSTNTSIQNDQTADRTQTEHSVGDNLDDSNR